MYVLTLNGVAKCIVNSIEAEFITLKSVIQQWYLTLRGETDSLLLPFKFDEMELTLRTGAFFPPQD